MRRLLLLVCLCLLAETAGAVPALVRKCPSGGIAGGNNAGTTVTCAFSSNAAGNMLDFRHGGRGLFDSNHLGHGWKYLDDRARGLKLPRRQLQGACLGGLQQRGLSGHEHHHSDVQQCRGQLDLHRRRGIFRPRHKCRFRPDHYGDRKLDQSQFRQRHHHGSERVVHHFNNRRRRRRDSERGDECCLGPGRLASTQSEVEW
jgi:hypothetical protein